MVDFVPRQGDSQAKKELKYDVFVAPAGSKGVGTENAGLDY